MIFHIVGRTVDSDNGDALDLRLDALQFNGAAVEPQFYSLVLKPGVDPAVARLELLLTQRSCLRSRRCRRSSGSVPPDYRSVAGGQGGFCGSAQLSIRCRLVPSPEAHPK